MELAAEEQALLLKLARQSIASGLDIAMQEPLAAKTLPPALKEQGAAFITLTENSELRGCIGTLEAYRPLYLDVKENAAAAAFEDYRFPQVTKAELEEIRIEISLLGKLVKLEYKNGTDLQEKLQAARPGVVITAKGHRATFLPQVWEELPQAEQFLTELCRKAGLPGSSWQENTLEVYTYSVSKFSEPA